MLAHEIERVVQIYARADPDVPNDKRHVGRNGNINGGRKLLAVVCIFCVNGIYVGGIERIFVNSGGTVPECYAVGERPRRAVVQRKIYFDILQRVLYLVPYFRLIARKSALNVQFALGQYDVDVKRIGESLVAICIPHNNRRRADLRHVALKRVIADRAPLL